MRSRPSERKGGPEAGVQGQSPWSLQVSGKDMISVLYMLGCPWYRFNHHIITTSADQIAQLSLHDVPLLKGVWLKSMGSPVMLLT